MTADAITKSSQEEIPILHDIKLIYDLNIEIQIKRYQRIADKYKEFYGYEPMFFVRAPGRVNLIGEHIDYEGYSVLPMAIANDIVIAVGSCSSNKEVLRIANTDSRYSSRILDINPKTSIDRNTHDWSHYFLSGYKGAFDLAIRKNFRINKPKNMLVMVDGQIPAGAGLSSSSAFVVASALATTILNKFTFNRRELAEICCEAEHYVGTMGGGMDQAASCLGEKNSALYISFKPLKTSLVTLPESSVLVIANSMKVSEKAVHAATLFNKRVLECLLAAKLIAKQCQLSNWREITTLKQLHEEYTLFRKQEVNLNEMQELVKKELHQDAYITNELEDLFGLSISTLVSSNSSSYQEVISTSNDYKLYSRAVHCYSEAERVLSFANHCSSIKYSDNEKLLILGELMEKSHSSCRDLYECSCFELDQLVDICKQSGAIGCRLTGAGWGGSVVCLVKEHEIEEFLTKVKAKYYSKYQEEELKNLIFATKASMGIAVYIPPSSSCENSL